MQPLFHALSRPAAGGCFFGGCNESESETSDEIKSGGSNVENPLWMLVGLSELVKKAKALQAELENMKPVDPTHFSILIEGLPDVPSGERALGEPKGATNQMGGYALSNASNTYTGPNGEQITVKITDFAFN